MDTQTKNLIRHRAQRLFPFLNEQLHYKPADESLGNSFRFCFLILRSPKAYLEAFRHGELMIDLDLVDDIYWEYRSEVPEPAGLMMAEKAIIADHNDEARAFLGQHNRAPILRIV